MADRQALRDIIVLTVEKALPRQKADGSVPDVHAAGMIIYPWALCYSSEFEGNAYYRDGRLLDAILRLGDYNCDTAHPADEWTHVKWMEAMKLIEDELDGSRIARWRDGILRSARHIERGYIDMPVFDGQIPNHGIWAHAFMYRVGQVFDIEKYRHMASEALGRVFDGQSADGCWREGASDCLFVGTPVTGYNAISAQAVNLYYAWSGDERAAEALDRAWRWYYDFLLPDHSTPPTLDSRQNYHPGLAAPCVAAWWNKPEGRWLGVRGAEKIRDGIRATGGVGGHGHGKIALQYPFIEEELDEREPSWPEYTRMVQEEACIRRRNGWTAVLSGMTNYGISNVGLRLFQQERQDCLSLAHQRTGLLIGSAHSQVQQELATFAVYQDGAVHYAPLDAYLKSTPPLDTLLLRYGGNVMALSVDTTQAEQCSITFSMEGERGRSSAQGRGHALGAAAARARLMLRLHEGDVIKLGDESWPVEHNDRHILRLDVPPGENVDFGAWSLGCDQPWELRWPIRARDAYNPLQPDEWLAVAEVLLFVRTFGLGDEAKGRRPTATFRVAVKHARVVKAGAGHV